MKRSEEFWKSGTTWSGIVTALIAGIGAYTEGLNPWIAVLAGLLALQQALFRDASAKHTERLEQANAVVAETNVIVAESVDRLNATLPEAVDRAANKER